MSDRVRIPGAPSLVARAGGGLVFTGGDGSTWVDLASWPPRLVQRDEYTLGAARSPSGAWLAHVRRGERWSLRWYASLDADAPVREEPEPVPARDLAPLLAGLDPASLRIELAHAMRLDGVHWLGEHALVVPRHVGLGDRRHPVVERDGGWVELTELPAFAKSAARDRCPTACVRLGDGGDVLIWDGHAVRDGAPWSPHRLHLAWYRDHAPAAFGPGALIACDDGRLVELAPDRVVPHLPAVTATSVQPGPAGTFVVGTSSVPLWWSPADDWACELPPAVLGRRCDVVGVAPDGGLVVYDRRDHELAHVSAGDLAALPRRRASQVPTVAVPPVAALDELGAAARARIAGVGEQLVACGDRELQFYVGDRIARVFTRQGEADVIAPFVAVAHDGRRAASLDASGLLHEYGNPHGRGQLPISGTPRALVAGPDGAWLVVCAEGAWLVGFATYALSERVTPIALAGALTAAVDPAGAILFVGERAALATWTAGELVELPPTVEQLVACAPLGGGRFACAGEHHLFAFDARAPERELELFEVVRAGEVAGYATLRAPHLAASPSGRRLAWTATPTSIHVADVRGAVLEIALDVFYADEYSQPLDAPLAVRGLALTDETTLAVALDEARGNLIDLAARTARKLDPHAGGAASRWILFVGDRALIAE